MRDERTVARWLRGEAVMPTAAAAIEQAAAELGVVALSAGARRARKGGAR